MKKSIKKIEYDSVEKIFCVQSLQIKVFIQEDDLSPEILKGIVAFIEEKRVEARESKIQYTAFLLNGVLNFAQRDE